MFEDKNYINKWCGAGTQTCAYDVDKRKYTCQMLMPISTPKNLDGIKFFENIPKECINKTCRDCVYIHICPTCMGDNYYNCESVYHKNVAFCEFNKATIYANQYLMVNKWKNKTLKISQENELYFLKSVEIIEKEKTINN